MYRFLTINILLSFILLSIAFACNKPQEDIEPNIKDDKPLGEYLDSWTYSVHPTKNSNFDEAVFRIWVPDSNNVDNLDAILILLNHFNGSSLGMILSDEWQEYAINNNVGLMGVRLKKTDGGTYTDASLGSGQALITALDSLTGKHNIPKFSKLPFLLKGYSAGGMFSYYFSAFMPDRVIAFANIRGLSITDTRNDNNHIPGIFLIAENDSPQGNARVIEIVNYKRKLNSLWSFAIEKNKDHFGDLKASDELSKSFLSTALKKRLNPNSNNLIQIQNNSGWLGNNTTKLISSYDNYPFEKISASWFIDESFANAWVGYQK